MNSPIQMPWTIESLNFKDIDLDLIRDNEDLFFLLCGASFVESGSDIYSHNLVEHFAGDEVLQTWLSEHWEQEELQHGRALAAYVRHVWPEFDWDAGFEAFWTEYGTTCTPEQLESDCGLELAARCVVETGTATLYRALSDIADEPVLKQLTNNIRNDEVRHYKHFFKHYRLYQEKEGLGRYSVFLAIVRRLAEIKNEDSEIALRHVFNQRYPDQVGNTLELQRINESMQELLRQHIPAKMSIKMLLKPLDLPPPLQHSVTKPLTWITEKFL